MQPWTNGNGGCGNSRREGAGDGDMAVRHEENAGGELRTIETQGDVQFQLRLWGGPPAENSGLATGQMALHGGRTVFETSEYGRRCRIEFAFTPKRVVIKQTRGDSADCGFGHNIEAVGRFARTSRETPHFDDTF